MNEMQRNYKDTIFHLIFKDRESLKRGDRIWD